MMRAVALLTLATLVLGASTVYATVRERMEVSPLSSLRPSPSSRASRPMSRSA